jgi:BlaI family penicillinase repressor
LDDYVEVMMDNPAGKIQNSELEVMKVLWNAGGTLPLAEIRLILSERCAWEDPTIKTLVRRLLSKGAIRLKQRGVYSAVITEQEYSKWSARAFVNRVFAGSAKKLVASLVSDGQLSQDDIDELSAMFNGENNE